MPKQHDTKKRFPSDFFISYNDGGGMPLESISVAVLYDIRRAAERSAAQAERQTRILARIDKRLAKRIKLR